jgi:BirA family transcriptional regulator, biotin operon repressor / biotin---[acetyl-CoA-carboxylase] ligase
MHLHPAATAAGVRLIERAAVGSTNAEALAIAQAGERGPLWIVAQTQTAGRGRRGRTWVSKPGNLYATLLLTGLEQAAVAQLSFVAALAVHDAISEQAPSLAMRVSLKWPNDLLCDGRKVCGVLLEGESAAGRATVAIGIGVNCAHHPGDAEYPATDLSSSGAAVSSDMLLLSLSRTIMTRLAQWKDSAGFPSIRTDWLARAEGLGRTIRVRLHDRDLTGTFDALDERGYLLLRLADGSREAIAAGDVFPMHSANAEHA